MPIRVYSTLSKQKELFEPVTPGKVGIYLCGPTVYKPSHIGHAVGPIIFDAVKRYLTYRGFVVRWIVNITDIEDKLIAEAAKQGRTVEAVAREVEANYKECLARLGVGGIDEFPRATENIDAIIELVQRLVAKNAAYVVNGDVWFDHSADKDYGKLSGRSVDESLAGTRELAGEGKRHPADFALWKASKPGEPSWDSPWGQGRPGWHIECSAMSIRMLGETFDIHGGGLDLVFPHHENEIAQSETATGKPLAKYWMHNGLTRIATKTAGGELKAEKMSKSLGNIRTISSLLEQYTGEEVRAFVLSTQYRRPLDFSDEQLEATRVRMAGFAMLLERVERLTGVDPYAAASAPPRHPEMQEHLGEAKVIDGLAIDAADKAFLKEVRRLADRFYESMDDDFNTAAAMASLNEIAGAMNKYVADTGLESGQGGEMAQQFLAAAATSIVSLGRLLGLFETKPAPKDAGIDAAAVEKLIQDRKDARKAKDFARADAIRKQLTEMGVVIDDTPGGTVWRKA